VYYFRERERRTGGNGDSVSHSEKCRIQMGAISSSSEAFNALKHNIFGGIRGRNKETGG
jgi:hypothetical protein